MCLKYLQLENAGHGFDEQLTQLEEQEEAADKGFVSCIGHRTYDFKFE